ncbi:MAG: hypothetical protein ABI855_04235 [Bacteroidota bacterium]
MNAHTLTHLPPEKLYNLFMGDFRQLNSQCDELMQRSWQKALEKNKNIHRVEKLHQHGKTFVCDVNASSEKSEMTVHRIINNGNHFYSIAFNPGTHHFFHFSEHFFIRYRQRLNITIDRHDKLLIRFLQHNKINDFTFYPQKEKNLKSYHNMLPEGIAYGVYDIENHIYYYRTFISYSHLHFESKVEHSLPFTQQEAFEMLKQKFTVMKAV